MKPKQNPIGFLKTTAIGGLLFLLPVIVVGVLIGQLVPIVMTIKDFLADVLPGSFKTPQGVAFLVLLSIAIILSLCFVCGLLARRSLGRNLNSMFEKKLMMLFPRYAIIKEQMADSIGGEKTINQMRPVVVRWDEHLRLGFETERDEQAAIAAVYMPGSPDPWTGHYVMIETSRIQPLPVDFGQLVSTFEQLGRGSTKLLPPQSSKRLSDS
ncbi:MAG: DUF502 domain-containing protein [bacterium]|nr:DUF502 domain-containing protein [bacterium]